MRMRGTGNSLSGGARIEALGRQKERGRLSATFVRKLHKQEVNRHNEKKSSKSMEKVYWARYR